MYKEQQNGVIQMIESATSTSYLPSQIGNSLNEKNIDGLSTREKIMTALLTLNIICTVIGAISLLVGMGLLFSPLCVWGLIPMAGGGLTLTFSMLGACLVPDIAKDYFGTDFDSPRVRERIKSKISNGMPVNRIEQTYGENVFRYKLLGEDLQTYESYQEAINHFHQETDSLKEANRQYTSAIERINTNFHNTLTLQDPS